MESENTGILNLRINTMPWQSEFLSADYRLMFDSSSHQESYWVNGDYTV